jgi:hypothetical protein
MNPPITVHALLREAGGALLAGVVLTLCIAQQTAAAPGIAAAGADDSHGFAGYWEETRGPRRGPPGGPPGAPGSGPPAGPGPGGPPPGGGPGGKILAAAQGHLQPWVAQRLQQYQAALAAGGLPRTNANQCLPWAIPGLGIPGGPAYNMNIVTTAQQVVFMYELDHQARIVYLDQEHPAKLSPSYFGHSIGHWEGDTLIVDTVGFNDQTEIHDGIAHTAALHVTERLRISNGHLEDQVTFDDPGAYLTPITFVDSFERAQPFQEYVCAENNNEALPPAK